MWANRSFAPSRSKTNRCAPASSRRISSIPRESASMLERQSALADALAKGGRDGSGAVRGLRLGEVRGWSLVQVAFFPSTLADLGPAAGAALGIAGLPA